MSSKDKRSHEVGFLVDEVVKDLESKSYAEKYMKELKHVFAQFRDYASAEGQKIYSLELSRSFLVYYCHTCYAIFRH